MYLHPIYIYIRLSMEYVRKSIQVGNLTQNSDSSLKIAT